MKSREDFNSFIPAKTEIPEMTLKAVLIGALLAIVLGSANAYFGLYAGMTISAEERPQSLKTLHYKAPGMIPGIQTSRASLPSSPLKILPGTGPYLPVLKRLLHNRT